MTRAHRIGEWKAEQPMGLEHVASGLKVKMNTVVSWRHRNQLPLPDGYISDRSPWWYESTLVDWAIEVGHVPFHTERSWEAVTRARASGYRP